MKRQNMNKRAGSLETTLLKRIMLLPTAIKNIRSSSDHGHWERHSGYCYPHTYLHTHTHLPTVQTRFSSTRPWTRFEDWCMRGGLVLYETLNMAFAMCCHVATKTDSVSSKWPRAAPPRRLHRMAFGRCFPGLRNWTNLNKPFKHQTPRSFG